MGRCFLRKTIVLKRINMTIIFYVSIIGVGRYMRRIIKFGLIALTLLAAVSCRNIVFIPVDTGSGSGGGV